MTVHQRQSSMDQNQSVAPDYGEDVCLAPAEEHGGVTVQESDLSDRRGEVREATEDMGEVDSLGTGFSRRAGSLLDALMPNEGDKGKAQINVNIPVDQTGTVRVGFEFIIEGERDENGVKGRIQIGGGVTATVRTRVFFATFSAFAQAQIYGYMESVGQGGAQMIDHMMLGIQQRLHGASETIADAIFNRQQIEEIIENMRETDYVESGLGASVSAGVGVSSGDDRASAGAGVNASTGTRLSGNGRGGLESADVSQVTGTLGGSADPFSVQGSLQGKWSNGELAQIEGKLEGEAMVDAGQLNELVMGGQWLSGMIGSVAGILSGGSGLLQDENAARQVGGLAAFVRQSSGIGMLAEGASARALSQLRGMGVSLGHKLTVAAKWEQGKGFSLEVALERVQRIEFSAEQLADADHQASPRDTVYVLVENLQRVFRLQVGG